MRVSNFMPRYMVLFAGLANFALLGCTRLNDSGYRTDSGFVDGYSYNGMWRQRKGVDEIVHVFFSPKMASVDVKSGQQYGSKVDVNWICELPEGLFVYGRHVDTTNTKVFVFCKDRTMREVTLSQEDLAEFGSREKMKELKDKDVWTKKIQPILVDEVWPEPKPVR